MVGGANVVLIAQVSDLQNMLAIILWSLCRQDVHNIMEVWHIDWVAALEQNMSIEAIC